MNFHILTQQGAQALNRAYFGQGSDQPIVLDNVRCDSSEMTPLQCSHNGLFRHDCDHREDAGVKCSKEVEGLLNIIIRIDVIDMHAVSINWELQNIRLHRPNSYEVKCFSEAHHIEMSVNNTTFNIQLMGLLASISYNCCVSAVYESYIYTPKGACSETTTMNQIQPRSNFRTSSSADIVGGVLGFIIALLLILLAISGAALVYLLRPRFLKSVITKE